MNFGSVRTAGCQLSNIALALLFAMFYCSTIGWIGQDSLAAKNKQAVKLYKEGNIGEALNKWRDAQIQSPDNEALFYNIGNALHEQKKYDDALKEYEKALHAQSAGFQARAYYNMGNTAYRQGKLDEAIEYYKKCLDINPDDEDAKYNIEFIRKKIKENLKKEGENKEAQTQEERKEKEKESQEGKEEKEAQKKEEEREAQQEQQKGEMSKEDAIRLLDALKDDEKDIQKELRTHPVEGGYRVEKDW